MTTKHFGLPIRSVPFPVSPRSPDSQTAPHPRLGFQSAAMEAAILLSSSSMGLQFLLFLQSNSPGKWHLGSSLSLFLAVFLCELRRFVVENLSSSFHGRASGARVDGEAAVAQGVGRDGAYYFLAWQRSLDSGGHSHGAPASTEEKSSSFWIHSVRVCECDQQHWWKFLEAN